MIRELNCNTANYTEKPWTIWERNMDSTNAFASTFQGIKNRVLGAFGSVLCASSFRVFCSNIPTENAGKHLSPEILGLAVTTNAHIPINLTVILPGQYQKKTIFKSHESNLAWNNSKCDATWCKGQGLYTQRLYLNLRGDSQMALHLNFNPLVSCWVLRFICHDRSTSSNSKSENRKQNLREIWKDCEEIVGTMLDPSKKNGWNLDPWSNQNTGRFSRLPSSPTPTSATAAASSGREKQVMRFLVGPKPW